MKDRTSSLILMYSTQNVPNEWFGSRVSVSTHRTRHCLERSGSTLSPRLEAVDMEMMSACSLGCCFPCKVTVTYSTFRRYIWWRRKEVRFFRMSPAHRVGFVFSALALCPAMNHLRAPCIIRGNTSRGSLCRNICMNPTRRTSNRTLIFTWCTGTCQCWARESYWRRRTRWARRTRVCSVWHKPVGSKKSCDDRRNI